MSDAGRSGGSSWGSTAAASRAVAVPVHLQHWQFSDRGYSTFCWAWTGYKQQHGYGVGWSPKERRKVVAHRLMFEAVVGTIPEGLTIDHLCRQRDCVNPNHLEPVSHRENCLRGTGVSARNARKTHCPHGHPYDEANTYIEPSTGRRRCAICKRAVNRRYHARLNA